MIKQRSFTVEDFMLMDEAGLFVDQRNELINGVIHDMSPTNPDHADAVNEVAESFFRHFLDKARISVQNPITLRDATWMPVPDIVLTKLGDYSSRHPAPEDILLLVEVSSTTLETDLGPKLEKYADAGISEYWIADLGTREWIVHRDCAPGRYRSIIRVSFDEAIAPQAFPDDAQAWLANLSNP